MKMIIYLLISHPDMFPSLSTATDLSTRRAFANPPPAAAVPASPPAPALDAAAQQVALAHTIYLQIISEIISLLYVSQAMALRFSEQSGMNLEWSGKCLVENRWSTS